MKATSRHAGHGQVADYDHTNQEGKDKAAAAALLAIEVPIQAKKSSTELPHSSSNSETNSLSSSSLSSSSSSSVVPYRKRRNVDDRRCHRKQSKSRNRSLPGSRSPASSQESPSCPHNSERRPHSRRQVEEFNHHHHSNRQFHTSTTTHISDQQQSRSLSPLHHNSKCLCVIHVCLFLTLFISFFCSHF